MSILSMFALLALAGIVVNNSIILVATIERRYDEQIQENDDHNNVLKEAIINGVVDRLRPVLLTSLTTIGGLSALLFEKSLQAQFLIPMAATIVFGLAVTAFLVLVIVPSIMGISNDISKLIKITLILKKIDLITSLTRVFYQKKNCQFLKKLNQNW